MVSFVSVDDFDDEQFCKLFERAAALQASDQKSPASNMDICKGTLMSMIFFQPSTRTSSSFEKAMKKLGGDVYSLNTDFSCLTKGETLEDTARMVAMGAQLLAIRHPEEGVCRRLSEGIIEIPVINAGEGIGEHPTQALLDIYTIWQHFGERVDDIKIGIFGDMFCQRSTHSLMKLGSRLGADFVCIAPDKDLQMPQEYIDYAKNKGAEIQIADRPSDEVMNEIDVLYIARIHTQERETRGLPSDIDKKPYVVTPSILKEFKSSSIILHPLPRNGELPQEIDTDKRAKYFDQAKNGIFTRMALIEHLATGI